MNKMMNEFGSLTDSGIKEPVWLRTKRTEIKTVVRMQSHYYVWHARNVKYIPNLSIALPDFLFAMWFRIRAVKMWWEAKVDTRIGSFKNLGDCPHYFEGYLQHIPRSQYYFSNCSPSYREWLVRRNHLHESYLLLWLYHHNTIPKS